MSEGRATDLRIRSNINLTKKNVQRGKDQRDNVERVLALILDDDKELTFPVEFPMDNYDIQESFRGNVKRCYEVVKEILEEKYNDAKTTLFIRSFTKTSFLIGCRNTNDMM